MKAAVFCLFLVLPALCGEWEGPFWVQMILAMTCFVPVHLVLRKELPRAMTMEEWEARTIEYRESDGAASKSA